MKSDLKSKFITVLVVSIIATLGLTACSTTSATTGNYAQIPVGKAYAEGVEIYFSHTEASDAAIAEKLTNMMQSPVLYVPSLAQIPVEVLAEVYVFENGVSGNGPLGFQADVFNAPPSSEAYSPLRQILLVNWVTPEKAIELKSETEILNAQANGDLTITESGVVVNMPFMVWDGGKR